MMKKTYSKQQIREHIEFLYEQLHESKKEENPNYDPKIQKILNTLISEEILAGYFYDVSIVVCNKDNRKQILNLFNEIAQDEIHDHKKHLIDYAISNGYDTPFKHKDLVKYASSKSVSLIDNLKNDQPALYYVDSAIESEKDAINSYDNAMKYENIPYELNAILLQIKYDEQEHLEKLNTLRLGCDANVNILF